MVKSRKSSLRFQCRPRRGAVYNAPCLRLIVAAIMLSLAATSDGRHQQRAADETASSCQESTLQLLRVLEQSALEAPSEASATASSKVQERPQGFNMFPLRRTLDSPSTQRSYSSPSKPDIGLHICHHDGQVTKFCNPGGTIQETHSVSGGLVSPDEAIPRFRINETTQVISVDENTDEGVIWAELDAIDFNSTTPTVDAVHWDEKRINTSEQVNGASATNFSVYLISHYKNHLAILIDIENITLEPVLNCEYQELKFSIAAEPSADIEGTYRRESQANHGEESGLEDRDASQFSFNVESAEGTEQNHGFSPSSSRNDDELPGDEDKRVSVTTPMSEALHMILNMPLNITLTDPVNWFKRTDESIDVLCSEVCSELMKTKLVAKRGLVTTKTTTKLEGKRRQRSINSTASHDEVANGRTAQTRPSKIPSIRRKIHKSRDRNWSSNSWLRHCNPEEVSFRKKLAARLDKSLEWVELKSVCGKVRRIIVPMRSLKLSLISDEFAPKSRFVIRYKFISDPGQLPARDNDLFYCRNRKVIRLKYKCDGYDDCGDASDESVKICGYPSAKELVKASDVGNVGSNNSPRSSDTDDDIHQKDVDTNQPDRYTPAFVSNINDDHHAQRRHSRKKLTYFDGSLLHCCHSSEWQDIVGFQQPINLHSLIGESMQLFTGPAFVPTSGTRIGRRVKRIVGGTEALKSSWPGQVSLQLESVEPTFHFCAGTLVHPQYVLTAGHCISHEALSRGIKVVVGAHDLRQIDASEIHIRYADDAIIYPGVDLKHISSEWDNDMNNDIAILRLNAPILIGPSAMPACLPPFATPLAVNTTCRSIGWGRTHGSGSSNLLKYLPLTVVESSKCSEELFERDGNGKNYGLSEKFTRLRSRNRAKLTGDLESGTGELDEYNNRTMICVNNDQGHGICQGDSGGPLYCDRLSPSGERCTELYGVASFIIQYTTLGVMCAVKNLPGIFSEVSSKTEWILSTIKMFEQSYRLKYSTTTVPE